MTSCLVTTLKGAVEDDSLGFLGDCNIDVRSGGDTFATYPGFSITAKAPYKVIAFGGNIYNRSQTNLGSETTITTNTVSLRFDGNVKKICIRAGYTITAIENSTGYTSGHILLTADSLQYQRSLTVLRVLHAKGAIFSGDLLSFLKNHPKLQILQLWDFPETFKASDLCAGSALQEISLANAKVEGNIEDLEPMDSLRALNLPYSSNGRWPGNLAKLPKNLQILQMAGSTAEHTWEGTRDSNTYPIAMLSVRLGGYVDAALINMASCTKESPLGTSERSISVIGTRTSASDDAVTTLQNKGWTITVTPES